jgi:hypothetical protein
VRETVRGSLRNWRAVSFSPTNFRAMPPRKGYRHRDRTTLDWAMTPWFRMPGGPAAEQENALAKIDGALEAVACAARLLAQRAGSTRESVLALALRRAARQARRDLARLSRSHPSRSPGA